MKTNLITRAGFSQLQQELQSLWSTQRPAITEKVAWAASLGDRSENADYLYNKKLLREIDRRIRYLRKRLPQLRIIDYDPVQDGRVFFGAWVDLEDSQGQRKILQIVGVDEIYLRKQTISIDAPLARALLKKQVDDEVLVNTPTGQHIWYIHRIAYQPLADMAQ